MGDIKDKLKEYNHLTKEVDIVNAHLQETDDKIEKAQLGTLISEYVAGIATGVDILSILALAGHLEYLEHMGLDTNLFHSPQGVATMIAIGVSSTVALLGHLGKNHFDDKETRLCNRYNSAVDYVNDCAAKAENCKFEIEVSERSKRNRKELMKTIKQLHAEQDAEDAEGASKE